MANLRTGRQLHLRTVMPWLLAALVAAVCLACKCHAKWHTYKPSGAVDGQGIYKETMSRCPQYMLRQIGSFDKATQCHEATHGVDGDISQSIGQSYGGFYVGDGKAFIVTPAPNVTVGQVAKYVPQDARTSLFKMYLTGDRESRNCLSLIDEFTCYANDAQCTKELGLTDDGGLRNAQQFSGFMDALVHAVKTHDPNCASMQRLLQFVAWQKARVNKLAGIPENEHSLIKATAANDPAPADIPLSWRELNRDGSCVSIAWANSMRHLGLHKRARDYRNRFSGGETPSSHKRNMDRFGSKYAQTTDGDRELIEYAIKNRRMISLTDMPMHYRNIMGRKNGKAVILGNGQMGREQYQYIPWNEEMSRLDRQGGWAVVCLEGCPPPLTPE